MRAYEPNELTILGWLPKPVHLVRCHQHYREQCWALPGGGCELGEPLVKRLMRMGYETIIRVRKMRKSI